MYDINNVTDASDNDTEAQANLRKTIRETLEGMSDSGTILAHALGAASGCWDDLNQAGVFRVDLMHVIWEETLSRLNQPPLDDTDNIGIYGEGLDAWITYSVDYHTCGGYGPESGYHHEPGCGEIPMLQLKDIKGIEEWFERVKGDL